MNTQRKPEWRGDIKGQVAAIKADCVDSYRGAIQHADYFMVAWDDAAHVLDEYARYLTDAELAQCFKAAQVAK